ncbi:hypothetical protein L2E82_36424 [Cichorium intybus]|uniref:Uncharacterized protein n=1 Tax=Cichorium intybus TaxID=13427 RepID=A0ACB9BRH4_CICIN|nr:hypothetical protein L2E82_36424 [Cichorium intybus]
MLSLYKGGTPINNTTSLQEKKVEQSNPKPDKGKDVQKGSLKGRASAKPKPETASVKTEKSIPISNDAQVLENEMVENDISDDENDQIKFKRGSNGEGSNRKRRVMFDYSDEDDEEKDAVSLASPDLPKKQVSVDLKTKKPSLENKNLDFDEQNKEKAKVSDVDSKNILKEESHDRKKGNQTSNENLCAEKNDEEQKNRGSDAAKNAIKKRKVLKTRIDERGREVTEVVWEDDEKETKHDENTKKDKTENNTSTNNVSNRPLATALKKSPAVGNAHSNATCKTGNKKSGSKDPKQGNIMSFFKKK